MKKLLRGIDLECEIASLHGRNRIERFLIYSFVLFFALTFGSVGAVYGAAKYIFGRIFR